MLAGAAVRSARNRRHRVDAAIRGRRRRALMQKDRRTRRHQRQRNTPRRDISQAVGREQELRAREKARVGQRKAAIGEAEGQRIDRRHREICAQRTRQDEASRKSRGVKPETAERVVGIARIRIDRVRTSRKDRQREQDKESGQSESYHAGSLEAEEWRRKEAQ